MKKEIEINRHFKSAEKFYDYCQKQCEKKGISLEDWMENLEQFENPIQKSDHKTSTEVCVMKPYEWHLFCKGSFNFIMEFDFYTETEGFGYLYILEN